MGEVRPTHGELERVAARVVVPGTALRWSVRAFCVRQRHLAAADSYTVSRCALRETAEGSEAASSRAFALVTASRMATDLDGQRGVTTNHHVDQNELNALGIGAIPHQLTLEVCATAR